MKILIAAFAIAFATPAAAQPAADPHLGHGQPAQSQHPGHGQHQPGQHQPGQHQPGQHPAGHDCPCCRPAPNGQRPDCCARMHQQQSGQDGHRDHRQR